MLVRGGLCSGSVVYGEEAQCPTPIAEHATYPAMQRAQLPRPSPSQTGNDMAVGWSRGGHSRGGGGGGDLFEVVRSSCVFLSRAGVTCSTTWNKIASYRTTERDPQTHESSSVGPTEGLSSSGDRSLLPPPRPRQPTSAAATHIHGMRWLRKNILEVCLKWTQKSECLKILTLWSFADHIFRFSAVHNSVYVQGAIMVIPFQKKLILTYTISVNMSRYGPRFIQLFRKQIEPIYTCNQV